MKNRTRTLTLDNHLTSVWSNSLELASHFFIKRSEKLWIPKFRFYEIHCFLQLHWGYFERPILFFQLPVHACGWCNVYFRFWTRYFTREIKLLCFPVIYFAPSVQTSMSSSRDSPFSLRWVNKVKNILPASPSLQGLAKQQFNFIWIIIFVPGDSKKTAIPTSPTVSSSCNAEPWLLFIRLVTSLSVSVLISWIHLETVTFESGTSLYKVTEFFTSQSFNHFHYALLYKNICNYVGFSSPSYLVTHVKWSLTRFFVNVATTMRG